MRAITLASNVPAAGPALAPSSTGTLQFPPVLWRSYQGLSDLLPGGWRGGWEAAAQPPGGPRPARLPQEPRAARCFPRGADGVPECLPPRQLGSVRRRGGRCSFASSRKGLAGNAAAVAPHLTRGGGGRCVRRCRVVAARPRGPSRTRVPSPRLHVAHDSRGSAAARSKPALPRAGVCVGGGV